MNTKFSMFVMVFWTVLVRYFYANFFVPFLSFINIYYMQNKLYEYMLFWMWIFLYWPVKFTLPTIPAYSNSETLDIFPQIDSEGDTARF